MSLSPVSFPMGYLRGGEGEDGDHGGAGGGRKGNEALLP